MGRRKHEVPRLCRRADGTYYVSDPTRLTPAGKPSQHRLKDPEDYERWRAEFLRAVRSPAASLRPRCSIEELCERYLIHAAVYYRKEGRRTSGYDGVKMACRLVLQTWKGREASSMAAADMKALQQAMIDAGLARNTINNLCSKVRTMWRWGMEAGAVTGEAVAQLGVKGLKRHRTEARETAKVTAPPLADVEAAVAQLKPRYRAIAQLQFYGGARPGEICGMRGRWVDRSGAIWRYDVPADLDKTHHHRRESDPGRKIWFGPTSQPILGPLLDRRPPDAPLFPTRTGRRVGVDAFRAALKAACRRAGVPPFRPNQLRHAMATRVRQRFGLDGSQVFLGHAHAEISEIYAETRGDFAQQIAAELG